MQWQRLRLYHGLRRPKNFLLLKRIHWLLAATLATTEASAAAYMLTTYIVVDNASPHAFCPKANALLRAQVL